MRIAVISTPYVPVPPPRYGGTELIVAQLVDGLFARGHDVTLYATGDSVTDARLRARFPRPVWPPDPIRELDHVAHAIHDLLASAPVDVIHAHVPSALPFARFLDAPLVYTVHHAQHDALSSLYEATLASNVRLVAISARQRELLGPAGGTAEVVHHGLDPSRYPPGPGGGGAAFLGRFSRGKGVHTAIDVAIAAGVPIRLAGRAHWDDTDYFAAEVSPRLGHQGVEWLGEAGHVEKVELVGHAAATLMPLAWEEPFGLVMIESMLCGTPVLAFPRGAAPEIVDPGVTGWIVADEDEMAWWLGRLAAGVARFDRARCRARAAERFGLERMVDEYLAIYRDAAGEAREPGLGPVV